MSGVFIMFSVLFLYYLFGFEFALIFSIAMLCALKLNEK